MTPHTRVTTKRRPTKTKTEGPEAAAWREVAELLESGKHIFLCHAVERFDDRISTKARKRQMLFSPQPVAYVWWACFDPNRTLAAWFLYHMAMEEGV